MADYMRLENDALETIVFIIPTTLKEKLQLMWQSFRGRIVGTMYVQDSEGKRTKSYLICTTNKEQADQFFENGEWE